MGTGEHAGGMAGGAEDGLDHGGGGALALGTGDMDGAAAVLGRAEPAQQRVDAVEREFGFGATRARAALEIGEAHQPVDGGGVIEAGGVGCSRGHG